MAASVQSGIEQQRISFHCLEEDKAFSFILKNLNASLEYFLCLIFIKGLNNVLDEVF